jgi:uncharacterized protein YegL
MADVFPGNGGHDLVTPGPEPRCPVVLVLDTSGAMAGAPIDALDNALGAFAEELKHDPIANARVEAAIITFGPVQIVQDFVGAADFEPPILEASGGTPLGEAVIQGLNLIEERTSTYVQNDVPHYRPWLLLISEGASTDDISAAAERARQAEADKRASIFAVGVGDDFDREELVKVSPARQPLKLKGLAFTELFRWVSASLSTRARGIAMASEHHEPITEHPEPITVPPISGWAPIDSRTDRRPAAPSDRILARGTVLLGTRLSLEQHAAEPRAQASSGYITALPDDHSISLSENRAPLGGSAAMLPMQKLEYQLDPVAEDVCISDDGLVMCYGVFGAPGSGKTYLLLRILRQLIALSPDDGSTAVPPHPDSKYGICLLDPKAELIEKVKEMASAAGRPEDDVLVIRPANDLSVNLIDCSLNKRELARALVLAGQSAGVDATEPYWFGSWRELFEAAIYLLTLHGEPLTLRDLIRAVLVEDSDPLLGGHDLLQIARRARAEVDMLGSEVRDEALTMIKTIDKFFSGRQQTDPREVQTVTTLINEAYGAYLSPENACLSQRYPEQPNFYDSIINDGKIVIIAVSPSEPGFAKNLCTLTKNLFMQSVRSRHDRFLDDGVTNFTRPLLLACDEYSQVASEVPGEIGDGDFFSIARQNGCMGVIATQSVNVLEATSLKEHWKSVFSTFAAKIFMKAVDNDTVEQATSLSGDSDWVISSLGTSSTKEGVSFSQTRELRERKALPDGVLTQLIKRGQGVVIGTLDGESPATTTFLSVPK